jgi:thiol-disulfide isomerase/thioredoxin
MRTLPLLVIALLALASCAERRASAPQASAPEMAETPAAPAPADSTRARSVATDAAKPEAPRLGATAPASAPTSLGLRPATAEQILSMVHGTRSRAVMINVWATWCGPCRAEFPDVMRLYRDYHDRGLELLLVSADFEDESLEAERFLARHGVNFTTYIKTGDDMQFINAMNPKWTGAIPATFIYDGEGRLVYFHEGMGTYEKFEKQVLEVLNEAPKGVRS